MTDRSCIVPQMSDNVSLLAGKRILIVDDDESVRHVMGMILSDVFGAVPVPCASGREALKLIPDPAVVAVLLDLSMPEMDGEHVFDALTPEQQQKVLIVTGDIVSAGRNGFLKRAARPCLLKPVDIDVLETELNTIVSAGNHFAR